MSSERGKKRRLMEVYDDDDEDKVYRFKILLADGHSVRLKIRNPPHKKVPLKDFLDLVEEADINVQRLSKFAKQRTPINWKGDGCGEFAETFEEGLTAEEMATKEPDESQRMQMTDGRCSRCSKFKVGLRDVIQAGHGDRYQLECIACGHSWYASGVEASTLTIDALGRKNVSTAPWATTKFEAVEKSLVSPREAANDVLKKTSEAYMPVLNAHRSFSKSSKKDDNPETPKTKEH